MLVAGLRNLGFSDDAIRKMTRGASDEVDDAVPDGDGYHAPCSINSFSAETVVMTKDGPVPIRDIRVGDMVLAYNEETGEVGYYPVTDLIRHIDPVIVLLTIDGELIETTPKHRFYETVSDELQAHIVNVIGWWTYAEQLEVGDYIYQADGTAGKVESITIVEEPQWMYDLTVDIVHTFFVGDGETLVHNCDGIVRQTKGGGRFTEPDLPPKTIVQEDGVTISHYYRSGDHGPPHLHVEGGGLSTRIGQAGKPVFSNDPLLSSTQRAVYDQNKGVIRKSVDQIGRWYRFWEIYE